MSDFFSALARRAMGPAAVRPRAGSRFESGSGVGLGEQRHEQVPAAASAPEAPSVEGSPKLAVSSSGPAPDVAFDPAPVRERVAALRSVPAAPPDVSVERKLETGSAGLADVPPLTVPPARRRARADPRNVESDDSPPRRTPQALPHVAPLATLAQAAERIVHERTEQQSVRSLIKSRVIERLTAGPRPPGASRPPTAVIASTQAPAPATPRVEIHIGRIEVMPAAAPAVAPLRIEPPRPLPAQSLDAYLTERSSRHRS
jgi:hypothetical protein